MFYVIFYIIFGLLNFSLLIPLLDVLFNNKQPLVNVLPTFTLTADYLKNLFYFKLNEYIITYGKFGVLFYVCSVLFMFVIFKNLFGFLSQKVLTEMRVTLVSKLRLALFEQLSIQTLSFYQNEQKGNLLSIISNDVSEIENSIVTSIQTIFRDVLVIISTFIMLFYLSTQLTLFTLLVFPLSAVVISTVTGKLRKKANSSQILYGQLLSITEEMLSSVRIVKSFNAEKFINNKYKEANNNLNKMLVSISNKRELASPLSEVLGVLVIVIIIIYGGSLILNGKSSLTASGFIAYIAFYFQIIAPAKSSANAFSYLQKGLSSGERVLRILDGKISIEQPQNPIFLTKFDKSIQYEVSSFRYTDVPILKNISIKIEKGKSIALVGESGSGKSTLVDLLPRFYDLIDGEVLLDGINIKLFDIKSLRSQISIVSQEAILFNDSILNNITFGSEKIDKNKVIHAAKIANAHDFIEQLEEGYNTNIGDRGMRLSGGQKQRLTIARAIYKNAPILILDEATSALDTESERLVQEAINNLMQNRTSIVIAHRLSTIRHADEIIVLQKGTIAERGNHESLLNQNGIYKRLIDMQEVK